MLLSNLKTVVLLIIFVETIIHFSGFQKNPKIFCNIINLLSLLDDLMCLC